ncbi:MAG: glycoside hydrolase family 43 protein [Bacillus sp. (in: Bacteria)]|nr:glycoside hydrolase family 43 protein [Bacillus sp. (in: firmicutes)]MCM1426823.1 glycoside hydrolase family 43 protein [Eubacterium sp.]
MKGKKFLLCGLVFAALSTALIGCGKLQGKDVSEIEQGNTVVGISVHDPSIVKADGTYYIFGSHMEAAKSSDLVKWESFASGVNASNPLFDNLFDEDMKAFAYVGNYVEGGYAVWAPDVIYNETMGKWVMYFSTSHDWRTSNICFAVADEITGPYSYVDTLIYSGFTSMTADNTNLKEIMGEDVKVTDYLQSAEYNHLSYPNCIDPTVFYDKDGVMWMVYGSWSGGIWLLQIDEETGYPIHPEADEAAHVDRYFGKYLIGGLHNSCEGPYIFYDEESDYYYLLVSYGGLTREGGYQIRCFRSKEVDGEYLDASGNTFGYTAQHSSLGVKMMGNYMLPSLKTAYMAPGHCSALVDEDGKRYLVYHQRFDNGSEYHEPRVHRMFVNKDGWLVAAPFMVNGESQKEGGYTAKDVEGKWYLLNHGTDIGADIHEGKEVTLKGGSLSGSEELSGSYELDEGTCYMRIVQDGITYEGVLTDMVDEAGNNVRCFMGVGENNETVWAVMYL